MQQNAAKIRYFSIIMSHATQLSNLKSTANELPMPDPSISSILVPQRAEAATFGVSLRAKHEKWCLPTLDEGLQW